MPESVTMHAGPPSTGPAPLDRSRRSTLAAIAAGAVAALVLAVVPAGPSLAQAEEQQELVDRARITLSSFLADKDLASFRSYLSRAEGVLIVPQLVKGGFIVGGSGGSGVLLVRSDDAKRRRDWSDPAFYTLASGSIGLQIGGEVSEVVLLLMTRRAIDQVIHSDIKLGADLSVAAGPVGQGAQAGTSTAGISNAGPEVDIYAFSRSKGLYAGLSLEGSLVRSRDEWNRIYYGKEATEREILLRRTVQTDRARELKRVLASAG